MGAQLALESAAMDADSECTGSYRDTGKISKSNDAGPQGTP